MGASTKNPHPSPPSGKREAVSAALVGLLSDGFCESCCINLEERISRLVSSGALDGINLDRLKMKNSSPRDSDSGTTPSTPEPTISGQSGISSSSGWASMAKNLAYSATARTSHAAPSPSMNSNASSSRSQITRGYGGEEEVSSASVVPARADAGGALSLSSSEEEWKRLGEVGRKKDYTLFENVKGRRLNTLQGLELHTRVFNAAEQEKIVQFVYKLQKLGKEKKLRERTYSEPSKWMRGKGRVTLQFGCCYNYAVDRDGNPPGILREEQVDPLPSLFKEMIRRMVSWRVLPPSCVPNSCIVNIYDEGDCIPPHIDHHDFLRPFCTVSFLSECNILFGQNIRIIAPGEFAAPIAVPLPLGSVFILNGNGADVAKHCVPAVPTKRISITFRKMDDGKLPYGYVADPDLQGLRPLIRPQNNQQNEIHRSPSQAQVQQQSENQHPVSVHDGSIAVGLGSRNITGNASTFREADFPPLGGEADFPPLGGGAGSSSSAGKLVGGYLRKKPIRQ